MVNNKDAPRSVVKRLPVYLRILDNLIRRDVDIISSSELSEETGFTAEQIRKDLAYFGAFGTRGKGYNTSFLRDKILSIIGLDKLTNVIVIGAGHLGIALSRYTITKNPYVKIVGIFDNDPKVVGGNILGVPIYHVDEMEKVTKDNDVKAAIIAVPAEYAQAAVDDAIRSGVKVFLNFAPTKLDVPEHVFIHNADLSIELQSIIYYAST